VRTISLHDTQTGEIRPIEPREPGRVGIYACGPTVYGRIHVGNARPFVVFSLLKRFLEHEGYEVTLVVNITDVNDKIYAAAREAGIPSEELAREMSNSYIADTDGLGLGRPDYEPRASETIPGIIGLIGRLVDGDHAYATGGDVYFQVRSYPDYGALSHRNVEDMDQGEGVEGVDLKRDPLDFALWKGEKPGEDTAWDSPWGRGRPGWHIECSAMSAAYLGDVFDIHGGGLDLIFPHHENEIAQSRCAHGTSVMANYWMHNGFLEVEGRKMSKSEGNFVTIRELLNDWPGEVVRLNMLKTHYRSPMDWTLKGLEESAKTLDDWYWVAADTKGERPSAAVIEVLADDLNTPQMIASLHGLRNSAASGNERDHSEFAASLRFLGFLSESAAQWKDRKQQASGVDAEQVDRLISDRTAARARKDFKESDRIRDELAAMGVVIKDSKEGTTWEIAR